MKIRQKQQGFTLIELMITLVLSLLVTYGIAQVLISSNRSATTSDGVSQAQETARFVMSFLGNHIRDSGLDSIDDDDVNTRAVIGCDIAALNAIGACAFENNIGATEANISITAADVAAGGSVALSGDRLALAWIPPAGVTTDCTGTTIAGFAANMVIVNVFWVSFDPAANSNSLICQGNLFDGNNVIASSVPQAIANGVEAFQVLYGEATSALPIDRERNVSHYVNANEVTDWERVFAVKIAIMTRSINDVTNLISRKQYTMLDAGLYNLNDAVNYQVFTSTFAISNFQD
jgi:type IV pilus assembly protein PilW